MEKQTSIDWFINKLPIRMKNYLREEIETARKMHNQEIEISDEEIEQKSVEYSTDNETKDFCEPCCHDFQNGAKWYREQLKKKGL